MPTAFNLGFEKRQDIGQCSLVAEMPIRLLGSMGIEVALIELHVGRLLLEPILELGSAPFDTTMSAFIDHAIEDTRGRLKKALRGGRAGHHG